MILAAYSYASWEADHQGFSFQTYTRKSAFSRWGWLGLMLITAGFAGTASSWWEAAVWILLSLMNAIYTIQTWYKADEMET